MIRRFSAGLAAILMIAACGKQERAPEQSGQTSGMQGMSMRGDSLMPMMRRISIRCRRLHHSSSGAWSRDMRSWPRSCSTPWGRT